MPASDTTVINIIKETASLAQANFGIPLLAAYHNVWAGRVREYGSDLSELIDAGFDAHHPVYKMAQAFLSQNPKATGFKVGRRSSPAQQEYEVTPNITTEAELLKLLVEGQTIEYAIPNGASLSSIATAMATLIDAVVGVDASPSSEVITITPNRVLSARVTVTTPDDTQTFTVTINGVDYPIVSDSSGTEEEIRDALKAKIEAVAGVPVNITNVSTDAMDIAATESRGIELKVAATGSGVLTISSPVSANYLAAVSAVADGLDVKNTTPDPGLAADLNAIESEDDGWYGLGLDSNSQAEIAVAGPWTETRAKIFGGQTSDTDVLDASDTEDVASALKVLSLNRSFLFWHSRPDQYIALAMMGRIFPLTPGSATWAHKLLSNVAVDSKKVVKTGYQSALEAKNCNYYIAQHGRGNTFWGYMASGEWIQTTRGDDHTQSLLETGIFGYLASNDVVEYTLSGAGGVAGVVEGVLVRKERDKFLKKGSTVVTPPDVDDPTQVSPTDKTNRALPISASSKYAGAIHKVNLTVRVSV